MSKNKFVIIKHQSSYFIEVNKQVITTNYKQKRKQNHLKIADGFQLKSPSKIAFKISLQLTNKINNNPSSNCLLS